MYSPNNLFKDALDVSDCLTADTARSALFQLFRSLFKLTHKREVLIPSFCCESVLLPVLLSGGSPRLIDMDVNNYSISIAAAAEAIGSETSAVLLPHMFGVCAYSDALFDLYDNQPDVLWIDDACQAYFDHEVDGRRIGRHLDCGLISFDSSKPLKGSMGCIFRNSSKPIAEAVFNIIYNYNNDEGSEENSRELKRLQANYFSYVVGTHREFGVGVPVDFSTIDKLTPLYAHHLPPNPHRINEALASLRDRSRAERDASIFASFLSCLGEESIAFRPYSLTGVDRLWRFPVLLADKGHLRRLSFILRSEGIHVSNHYFSLSLLFPSFSEGCSLSESVTFRMINLWFDSIGESKHAAQTIRLHFSSLCDQ